MASYTQSVLITGATSGLGYHCALEIARQHPEYRVIIASRSDPDQAAKEMNTLLHQTNVTGIRLDLSSLETVRNFAAQWESHKYPPIQSLVCNAALQFPGAAEYTVDGYEKTFAISHIGHALLFSLLRPYLADKARVVIVSSGVHYAEQKTGMPKPNYISAEELAHPPASIAKATGRLHYCNTKLANVLYMYALHRRFLSINEKNGKHWTVTAFDPGLMPGTGLARDGSTVEQFLWKRVLPHAFPVLKVLISPNIHTAKDSGASLARLAVGEDVDGVSGRYFEGRREVESSKASFDKGNQEDLWGWTLKTLARNEDEKRNMSLSDLL
ncbi:Short-chain dehydrogenase/reductase SDR [Penicillium camemberti]|uniref:Short-chain dehydrogenase/reductase SDR n=1 Tax=Penicillium camemberti (strain FM 013) TaxID=1429867 RepID=A0A0G4P1C6_PENC3|nr:Short-chain dehydrogenase/reductase SDR [Penicillium camemberti]